MKSRWSGVAYTMLLCFGSQISKRISSRLVSIWGMLERKKRIENDELKMTRKKGKVRMLLTYSIVEGFSPTAIENLCRISTHFSLDDIQTDVENWWLSSKFYQLVLHKQIWHFIYEKINFCSYNKNLFLFFSKFTRFI